MNEQTVNSAEQTNCYIILFNVAHFHLRPFPIRDYWLLRIYEVWTNVAGKVKKGCACALAVNGMHYAYTETSRSNPFGNLRIVRNRLT